jgi:hypothetical protein
MAIKFLVVLQQFPIWGNLSLEDSHAHLSFLLSRLAHNFSWLIVLLCRITHHSAVYMQSQWKLAFAGV